MIPYGMMQIYFFVPACTEKGVWGYTPTSKVQRIFPEENFSELS
jgi:hypothetical protein